MADIVAGFLGPAIEVLKCIGAPIIRQFNYLCCFTSNIATLKDEAQKLDDQKEGLQGRVDRARDDVQVIVPAVETWLTDSKNMMDEMNGILLEVPNVKSGYLKLRARFSLSKRAKKTTDRIKELQSQSKFDAISQPGPPPATVAVPLGTTFDFSSRKQIEEDIMTRLRDTKDVNMIGICGMGGLGKTTMAKKIMNRALKEHVFEEVVMAVVSQSVDKSKIQEEIGGQLGLKNLKDETLPANRVKKLHDRLTSGKKRILLVLDDVWEKFAFEDLGIPCGCKGCTVLLTSRNHDVLRAMKVEKIFRMKVLPKEDAWLLFREIAGTCVDDIRLTSVAKNVVEECRGLPIALTTLAAALKDEKSKRIWKDAVTQLRKPNPTNIPDFIKDVYNALKVSYDKFDSNEGKSVFLLCCLFGEDANIPLDYLTYFCTGLRILEGGMEEARNSMCTLINWLKSRSLLLDGRNEDYVRMHDVIRDVCIFIAKEKGYIGGNDCTWLSSFQTFGETSKLPTNLRLLFLSRNSNLEEEIEFNNKFVEGIRDLYVLFIKQYYSLTSLPRTTWSLIYLNTLNLSSCMSLETISGVGELVNLEILICRECPWIKELPPEIKGLHRLKVLELTYCHRLQRIGRGIISSLVGLEELKIWRSFKKWEASDSKERENAELRELEALTNLTCLEIEIDDPALAAEKMHLSSKLERFVIFLISPGGPDLPRDPFSNSYSKKMSLNWEEGTCLGHWIEMQLLPETDCLYLSGNGANNLDLAKIQNISNLMLGKCKTMKNIVRTSMNDDGDASVFPSIDLLELFSLPDLKEIWDGPISSNSFQNLKKLLIRDLPALKQLWKSSSVRQLSTVDCLSQLEVLEIEECEMMEQVFLWNEEDDQNINNRPHNTQVFPKLKEVTLKKLPNLITFFEGIEGIEFPLLTRMQIEECPKMTSMVSSNENNSGGTTNADIDDHHYSHLFCQPQKVPFDCLKQLGIHRNKNPLYCYKIPVSLFSGLEELKISNYHGSMSLFSSSIAANLVNLKELGIYVCDEMVKVIKDDEEEKAVSGDGQRTTLLFPKLQELSLADLPKLETFCEWKCDVELPSLRKLYIDDCHNMKYFTLGSLTTPNLKTAEINDKYFGVANDLNVVLRKQYLAREKEKQESEKKGSAKDQESKAEIEEE